MFWEKKWLKKWFTIKTILQSLGNSQFGRPKLEGYLRVLRWNICESGEKRH